MMKKRLISLLIAFCLICSILPGYASGDTDVSLDKACALMDMMEVFPNLAESDFDSRVTRAEFALALARMLKIDMSKTSDVRYFTDMAMTHWAHTAVNALVDYKIISQSDDKLFNPDDYISYNEAVKMMTCALGYGDYALARGGYPYGYISAASRAKILEGVGSSGDFTLRDMVMLSSNTVCAPVYKITSIDNGNLVYEKSGEATLLSLYWDVYEAEGYLECVYGLSMTDKMPDEGEAIIDSDTYLTAEINCEEYVGQYVNFLYYLPDGKTKGELVYVGTDVSDSVEIDAESFISYSPSSIRFYDENDKTDSIKLASGSESLTIIKNGTVVNRDISLAFNMDNGLIKAVDSDGNGIYETVFINSCTVAQVTSVDAVQEVIYAAGTDGKGIAFSEKSGQLFRITVGNGSAGDLSMISPDDVLHIYESDNVITIHCTSDTVSGVLKETDSGDGTVTVGESIYPVYEYLMDSDKFSLGNSYTYFLDRYGKIAFAGSGAVSDMKYGFLHKVIITDGMDNRLAVRIFTESDGMIEAESGEKFFVDGEKYTPADAIGHLEEYGVSQLVLFRCDNEGRLSEIDTRFRGEKESEYTLSCCFEDLAEAIYFTGSGYNKFDRLGTFDTNNLRFIVPSMSIIDNAVEKDFIAARSGYFSNNSKFSAVRLYTTNPDNMYDTVALAYSTGGSVEHRPMLIDKVTQGVTEEGEVLGVVKGIENDYVSYFISSNYQKEWDELNLGQGDVVILDTNAYGEVVGATVRLHYTAGESQPNGMLSLDASPSQVRDLTGGYVLKKAGNDIEWSHGADVSTRFERLRIANDVKIAVFDSSLRNNQVYVGSINDVLDVESVGVEHASAIMLYAEYNKIGNIILHKRGWDD